MAGEKLEFTRGLTNLINIGDNFIIDNIYTSGQISRALYWHGKRDGCKYSSVKVAGGYMIILVEIY